MSASQLIPKVNSLQKGSASQTTKQRSVVYSLGELFCGAGGLALGAKLASKRNFSFRHSWVNDIDSDSCQTIAANLKIPENRIHCRPVECLDMSSLPKVDGVAFGFPCNDFSVVGERKGINGRYGSLYRYCVQSLKVLQPTFFVAENVGGIASSGNRRDMEVVLSSFEAEGYETYPHLYKFEQYGVPQARHRVVIVGFRKGLGVSFEPPRPKRGHTLVTSRDALKDIPIDAPNHEYGRQTDRVRERLKYIEPGENAFTAEIPAHLRLNMKSGATISQIYRRLDPDLPSYTVTGSGGGGTHMYHWEEPRALTNRERARLQTFPDTFRFLGCRESVRRQIGMAVPPLGAKVIFQEILKLLRTNEIQPI